MDGSGSWTSCLNLNHRPHVYSRVVAEMSCVENVWTRCKTKSGAAHRRSAASCGRSTAGRTACVTAAGVAAAWTPLQPNGVDTPWQPPDTFYRWGPKWSKGQRMHHTQPPRPPILLTPCFLSSSSLVPSGYWSVLPLFYRTDSFSSQIRGLLFWPHQPGEKWHLSPAASPCGSSDLWGGSVGYAIKIMESDSVGHILGQFRSFYFI